MLVGNIFDVISISGAYSYQMRSHLSFLVLDLGQLL